MMSEWRVNKVVDFINSGIRAEFMTLWEDQRDVMSDCVRPEWGISEQKYNRKIVVRDGDHSLFCERVTRGAGNQMYRDIAQISKMWNPFKQRAAVEEWAENGGEWTDESRRAWVLDGQRH